MLSQDVRPSVRPSVRLSVTGWHSVETAKQIVNLFSPSHMHSHTILFFRTKRYGNTPTWIPCNWRVEYKNV